MDKRFSKGLSFNLNDWKVSKSDGRVHIRADQRGIFTRIGLLVPILAVYVTLEQATEKLQKKFAGYSENDTRYGIKVLSELGMCSPHRRAGKTYFKMTPKGADRFKTVKPQFV